MTMLRRAERVGKKFLNPVPTAVGGLSMMVKVLPLYLANKEERFPKQPLGPFKTDVSIYETAPASGLRITWMGHSSLYVELDGVRILIDPVWDERASPVTWGGPKRFFAPPVALEELPLPDVILISHDHYDHLGAQTVRTLAKLTAHSHTCWVAPVGVGSVLQSFGVAHGRISELDWTEKTKITGGGGGTCEITALPARHFSGRSAFNRFHTLWASYVLKSSGTGADSGGPTIYYGADSGLWDGFAEIGAAYGPFDLTMLEIGAYNELWRQIHMGPDGAAQAFQELGGMGLLMPIHWGLFDLALHAWRQPMRRMVELAESEGLKLWAPEPGEPTEVVRGKQVRSGWWLR